MNHKVVFPPFGVWDSITVVVLLHLWMRCTVLFIISVYVMVCLLQMMQLDNTNMYYPYLCWHLWYKGHSCDDLGTTLVCAGIFGAIDIAMWTLLGFVCWVQMMMVSEQTYPVVSTGVWCKQPDYDDEYTDLSYCLRGCVVHTMWLWWCMYRSVMLSALVCVV